MKGTKDQFVYRQRLPLAPVLSRALRRREGVARYPDPVL
jgi:hypothetical protein